jgi:Putative lumazine-binding
MIKKTFILVTVLSFNFCMAQTKTDEEKVKNTLFKYINGRNKGDTALLSSAFHPTADLRYINQGNYTIWPVEEYVGGIKPGRKQDCIARIISIDILGTAAQAKIELEYPRRKFADYFNLLKIDNEWYIANKIFSQQPVDTARRILFVITSHEQLGTTNQKTGVHLGEVSHAYKPLVEAGFEVDFVSPNGGSSRIIGVDLNDSVSLWFTLPGTGFPMH